MAKLGVGLMVIPQKPWAMVQKDFEIYRAGYEEVNGVAAPQPMIGGFVFVDKDGKKAEAMAQEWISAYYHTVLKHYELADAPHKGVRGYEFYAQTSRHIERHGKDTAAEQFVELAPYGTPKQVIEKFEFIRETIGAAGFMPGFGYAGMPYDLAFGNMRCFAETVMPVLKSWGGEGVPGGAELAAAA